MSTEAAVDSFVCPSCGAMLEKPAQVDVSCDCGWRGDVYSFDPLPPEVTQAEVALTDDAVCSNHPNKKAIAICAGTGDYICDLCRVDIKGETYSIQYLDGGGQAKVQEAFANTLPRPDRVAINSIFLTIATFFYGGIIFIPLAVFYYWRAFSLRRTNPLFRRLVSGGRLVFIGFILTLFVLLLSFAALAVGFAVYEMSTPGGQQKFRQSMEEQRHNSIEIDRDEPPEF